MREVSLEGNGAKNGLPDVPAPGMAMRQCEAFGLGFARTFRYQFALVEAGRPAGCPGFRLTRLDGWDLWTCPDLHLARLADETGELVGALLGYAADASGDPVRDGYALSGAAGSATFGEVVEDFANGCGGRYAIVVAGSGVNRVFVDPTGSYGVVYDPIDRRVASSLLLALNREIGDNERYDNDRVIGGAAIWPGEERRAPAGPHRKYAFGATLDNTAKRLIANHRLDLDDFGVARHWPREGEIQTKGAEAVPEVAETIVRRMGAIYGAIPDDVDRRLSLSGGLDSRLVLAALSASGKAPCRAFSYASNYAGYIDLLLADQLARRIDAPIDLALPQNGLRSDFFRRRRRKNRERRRYLIGSGYIQPITDPLYRGAYHVLPDGTAIVRGNILEIAHAVWWPRRNAGDIDPLDHQLRRCNVSRPGEPWHEARRAEMADWLDGIPVAHRRWVHDLASVETHLAHGQPVFLGHPNVFYFAPASDRELLSACMSLDPVIRKKQAVYAEVMRRHLPQALEVPTHGQLRRNARVSGRSQIEAFEALFGTRPDNLRV